MEEFARLKNQLGPADRARVSQYLDTVREVERRIQKAEADATDNPLPDLDRPVGVPASYADHARLMFDLQVLALQGDVTRVITFQLARETSNRTYPEIGVSDPHHPLTHHGNDPDKIAKMAKINRFHVSLFAEFLAKLKATPEGNGTLLDHSLYLYGSGMGNPNVHDHVNLPILVAGGAAGKMQGGRHIRFAEADAARQPAPDAARQGRRAPRFVCRQPAARSTSCSSRFRCRGHREVVPGDDRDGSESASARAECFVALGRGHDAGAGDSAGRCRRKEDRAAHSRAGRAAAST